MARAQATTDHRKIRSWVEARGGHPAAVKTTRNAKSPGGLLRIDFGPQEANLEEIDWDEFFKAFDGNKLAFLYQENTADGHTSRFFKFVDRDTIDEEALNASEEEDEDYEEDVDKEDIEEEEWDEDDADIEDEDEEEDEPPSRGKKRK